MDNPSGFEQKRKRSRVAVNLLVNFRVVGEPNYSQGVTNNASETGLLINTFHNLLRKIGNPTHNEEPPIHLWRNHA